MGYLKLQFRKNQSNISIFNACNMELIEEIRTDITNELGMSNEEDLTKIHESISIKNINQHRLDTFKKINQIKNWKNKLAKAIFPNIQYLMGPDLAIQTQLNLSIQMPNDYTSVLEPHLDYRSGDSPFQRVIWIPLTNCSGTNCLYMNNKESEFMPVEANYGEIVVFDPNIIHGNVLNTTNKTRISVNIRIKNWFAPDMGAYIPDRQFGEYYEDFRFSKSTERAFKLIQETILK